MDIKLSMTDLFKLSFKYIGHKIVQLQLATRVKTIINTNYGKVLGLQRKTVYDKECYFAFEGIPYAKPPVDELRFRAPQRPEAWQGVLDCTHYRPKPMQKNSLLGIVEGSEDCLYLNVYAKKLESSKPLPVLVWIYGGGFQKGEATRDLYGPDYFMKQDVILVTFNYRLGTFGFLSFKDPKLNIPGNAGLKDQVLALRWVKENIANFNGDPNNITIFGESAGSASTHFMLITEQTRGLFHKAIMQSGTGVCAWAEMPERQFSYRLAQRIGYKGANDEHEIYAFLENLDAKLISSFDLDIITRDEERDFLIFAFGPCVEPYITEDCVLPKRCIEMLPTAWGNTIPIIIGGNSLEGLFSYQSIRDDPYQLSAFENALPPQVRESSTPEELKEMIKRLKETYFGNDTIESMNLMDGLFVFSHRQIWHDVHRTVLARQAYAPNAPTYLYRFDFDSPHFNHFRILVCGKKVRGVSHADELSYLFYNIMSTKLSKSSLEYKTIERMVGMWCAFAANSNPNCEVTESQKWLPVQIGRGANHNCLNIAEHLQHVDFPEAYAMECWDTFYKPQDLY